MREEIFGPVLVAMPFDDMDEAIRAANESNYGLAGAVYTRSLEKAHMLLETRKPAALARRHLPC